MQCRLVDMHSGSNLYHADFRWTVKQWNRTIKAFKELESDRFELEDKENHLLFYDDGNKKFLLIFLSDLAVYTTATAKAFVLDDNNEKHEMVASTNNEGFHRTQTTITQAYRYKYKKSFVIDEAILSKHNEDLVFFIELSYVKKSYEDPHEAILDVNRYCVIEKLKNIILDDYGRINASEEPLPQHSITFLIGDTKLEAHTLILSAACPYFAAMFRHKDFKENKERTINLTCDKDVTAENFKIFLDIIYGCKNIQDVSNNILTEICILADKYGVKELLNTCEILISRTITKKNVIELLLFADNYNLKLLKSKAVIHAKNNINDIKKMSSFDNVYNRKSLVLELL